ncbi:MAG: hypothetical protein CMH54_14915 [Myxococcales bacterium]|nr:hypothetical protein [Myxococcales bacterium]
MSHLAYQKRGPAVELDTDYIVVGTGAGGAAAAVGLARGGMHVTMVEAGAWRAPSDYPTSMYGQLRDMMDDWGSTLTRGRAMWPVVQGRGVGGTTVINSAIVVRTPGDIFRLWETEHGVGGDAMADSIWSYQDQIETDLSVEPVPRETMGRSNALAMQGAKATGLHNHDMLRNVKDCLGKGFCLQGCRAERKQSTALTYVPEVLERGGDLLSCAPVSRIQIEAGRAVGVEGTFIHPQTRAKGAAFRVRARKGVLIAASATHSPVLLLRSGIKTPSVGRYFRAHPGAGIFGVFDEPVDMNVGATQGWSSTQLRGEYGIKLETLSLPLELVVSRIAGAGPKLMERLAEYRHFAMWVFTIRAEAEGRVKAGFGGKPSVNYTLTPYDMERMRIGIHNLTKMGFAAGAKAVIPGIYGTPYSIGPDQVDQTLNASLDPRHWTGILSHLFGGCVMGSDPSRSVCDGRGKVHGLEGLYIADASCIPTTLGVNPQHTIMAIAMLRAEELLNDCS